MSITQPDKTAVVQPAPTMPAPTPRPLRDPITGAIIDPQALRAGVAAGRIVVVPKRPDPYIPTRPGSGPLPEGSISGAALGQSHTHGGRPAHAGVMPSFRREAISRAELARLDREIAELAAQAGKDEDE